MKIPRVIDTDFPPWRKFCRADKTMFAHPRDCLQKPMKSCHISMKKPHVIYFRFRCRFCRADKKTFAHPSTLSVIQCICATSAWAFRGCLLSNEIMPHILALRPTQWIHTPTHPRGCMLSNATLAHWALQLTLWVHEWQIILYSMWNRINRSFMLVDHATTYNRQRPPHL